MTTSSMPRTTAWAASDGSGRRLGIPRRSRSSDRRIAPGDGGRDMNLFGRKSDADRDRNQGNADEQALARYRYMLQSAPPEDIERAHEEAFAKLIPEQRRQALQALAQVVPPSEIRGDDPASLARTATRAEIRQPGTIERAWGGGGPGSAPGSSRRSLRASSGPRSRSRSSTTTLVAAASQPIPATPAAIRRATTSAATSPTPTRVAILAAATSVVATSGRGLRGDLEKARPTTLAKVDALGRLARVTLAG